MTILRPLALAAVPLIAAAPAPRVLDAQGLGPVRVGMSVAAAERALGGPLSIDYLEPDEMACGRATRRDGSDRGISYMIENGQISRVDIDTPDIRTSRDIGIGSTAAQVRQAYGAGVQASPHHYTDGQYFEVKEPGGRFGLIFEIEQGKVSTMRGGRYPAVGYVEGCA